MKRSPPRKTARRRSRRTPTVLLLVLLVLGYAGYEEFAGSNPLDATLAERVEAPVTKLRRSLEDIVAELREILQTGTPTASNPATGDAIEGWVERISDGDTVRLSVVGRDPITIRLYGIDAPERDQPYGNTAAQALSRKIDGARVSAVARNTDQYGRLVATLFKDGNNINLEMVTEGHAWWYQNYARNEQALDNAERHARAAERGLWADRNPVEPWVWRQQQR